MTDPKQIARGLTKAQQEALLWLTDRGGDGCFDRNGIVLAQGETAPVERKTWNALEAAGLVRFYGGKHDGGKGRGRIAVRAELAAKDAEIARLREALNECDRARVMIGARLDRMNELQKECAVNEAWHVLQRAIANANIGRATLKGTTDE